MRTASLRLPVLLALTALLLQLPGAGASVASRSKPASRAEETVLDDIHSLPGAFSTDRLIRYLKFFSSEPHIASSARNNELARTIRDEWKSFGLDDVRTAEYDVLLSFPGRISVEIVRPRKIELALREEPVAVDPDTERSDLGIPYNAYSSPGELTAPLVYANNGNPQDFDVLEGMGIDLRGKIALVRYSEPYSYRGFKALTAQRRGLAALLIYSDPKDDGAVRGPVFPDGPWGPLSHIQRGGIPFDFIFPGDPLTPGLPSIPGVKRLEPGESVTVPKIISVPLSARDALPIFQAMGGSQAPSDWSGALPVTYRLGGKDCLVHIDVRMDNSVRRIVDVIGCVRGSEDPDSAVLVGNHRDAWVFGALDPSSGTACLMELARAFGEARKAGFRPRRSVYFASWDAEEFTLTGSTEWGEENRDWLAKNLVAYLNVDSSASGPNFNVSAVPSLGRVVLRALRAVADPATGKSVYERWISGPTGRGTIATASGSGRINAIGSGSDHTVFLNHICAPALDMSFSGDYGVYHSAYDDYFWMSHFGDPGMRYTKALDEIWARQVIDLAGSPLVPLDYEATAIELRTWLDEWTRRFNPGRKALGTLLGLVDEMRTAASVVTPFLFERGSGAGIGPAARAKANRLLVEIERCFALQDGIPGRTWFKHLVFGTRSTYEALLLPELTEAAEAGNAQGVAIAVAHLEAAVGNAIQKLGEIARVLKRG
jgi:N-acetylated-alpha-linked acidic dipeptidase